jgi:hypothetical protein
MWMLIFAEMWHKEYSHLRDSVLSWSGYVIVFSGCPIAWSSILQTEIALSTTESKYIALSSATQELLPLWQLLADIGANTFFKIPNLSTADSIHTTKLHPSIVYEDNNTCIILCTTEANFKPYTKHISIKWHHFHDQIRNDNLQKTKVSTDLNWADMLTKPLAKIKFQKLQSLMMGW